MWTKKLKNNKMQFFIIGLILAFAAMILTACLSFSTEVTTYTDKQYDDVNNAALMLYVTKGTSNHLKKDLDQNSQISSYKTLDCYQVNQTRLFHNDNLVKDYINPLLAIILQPIPIPSTFLVL